LYEGKALSVVVFATGTKSMLSHSIEEVIASVTVSCRLVHAKFSSTITCCHRRLCINIQPTENELACSCLCCWVVAATTVRLDICTEIKYKCGLIEQFIKIACCTHTVVTFVWGTKVLKQEHYFLQVLAMGRYDASGNSPFLSVGAVLAFPFQSSPVDQDVELTGKL
jgi:hypothetical protein